MLPPISYRSLSTLPESTLTHRVPSRLRKISDLKVPPLSLGIVKMSDGKYQKLTQGKRDRKHDPLASTTVSRPASPASPADPIENWSHPSPSPSSGLPVPIPLAVSYLVPLHLPPGPERDEYLKKELAVCNKAMKQMDVDESENPDVFDSFHQCTLDRFAHHLPARTPPPRVDPTPNCNESHSVTPTNKSVQKQVVSPTPSRPEDPAINYHNPVARSPSPPLAYEGDSSPNPAVQTVHLATEMMAQDFFIDEMKKVDDGAISPALPRRFFSASPIPIPNPDSVDKEGMADLIINTAKAVNHMSSNLNVLFRRHEYSIAQDMVLYNQTNAAILDKETFLEDRIDRASVKIDAIIVNNESISKSISDIQDQIKSIHKMFGKSRYSISASMSSASSASPPQDLSSELAKISENISSLSAQIGSINSLNSSLPTRPASPPPVPKVATPAPTVPVSILRNNTPIVSSAPALPPSRPCSHTSTPKPPFDPYSNFSVHGINEGHVWFSEKASTLPDDYITWWARVLTIARWGPSKPNGYYSGISHLAPIPDKQRFIMDCIRKAFSPGGCLFFPLPPSAPVRAKFSECVLDYNWLVWTGIGNFPRPDPCRKVKIAFCPGTVQKQSPHFDPDIGIPSTAPSAPQPNPPYHGVPNSLPTTSPQQPIASSSSADPFVPVTSDIPTNDVYYEDLHPDNPMPWKTVSKGGKSFAQAAGSSNPPSHGPSGPRVTCPIQRKNTFSNSQKWILRYPKNEKPPSGSRPTPQMITDKVNRSCRDYHIRAIMADWTQAGNMSITFSHDTKEQNVSSAKGTIISLFHPSNVSKTLFSKAVPTSKILFPDIPCRRARTDDENYMEDDDFSPPLWSNERLLEEVKRSHPLLNNTSFVLDPDWTIASVPDDSDRANISFVIDDADGSIIAELTRTNAIMFSTQIFPHAWKEKVNLQQCNRCWRHTAPHPSCAPRCVECGSSNHDISAHNQSCQSCKSTGKPLSEITALGWICTHLRCANCGGAHQADNTNCQAHDEAIRSARIRRSGMTAQTILDSRDFRRPGPSVHF